VLARARAAVADNFRMLKALEAVATDLVAPYVARIAELEAAMPQKSTRKQQDAEKALTAIADVLGAVNWADGSGGYERIDDERLIEEVAKLAKTAPTRKQPSGILGELETLAGEMTALEDAYVLRVLIAKHREQSARRPWWQQHHAPVNEDQSGSDWDDDD